MPIVVVAGSRLWPETYQARNVLHKALGEQIPIDSIVYVGDNHEGVEKLTRDWCEENGRHYAVFVPLRTYYNRQHGLLAGRTATRKRDEAMLKNAYRFIAFWDGRSEGVGDTVYAAIQHTLPVTLYGFNGYQLMIEPPDDPRMGLDGMIEFANKAPRFTDTKPLPAYGSVLKRKHPLPDRLTDQ